MADDQIIAHADTMGVTLAHQEGSSNGATATVPDSVKEPFKNWTHRDSYFDKNTRTWQFTPVKEKAKTDTSLDPYVLIVVQEFDAKMNPCRVVVDVRAERVRRLICGIYRNSTACELSDAKIRTTPHFLFWARERLAAVEGLLEGQHNDQLLFEIRAVLAFCEHHFAETIPELDSLLGRGKITFSLLWAIMPPDVPIYGKDEMDEPRIWIARNHHYAKDSKGEPIFQIEAVSADSNGNVLGFVHQNLVIRKFNGLKALSDLPYGPIHHLNNREQIWSDVLQRNKIQLRFHNLGPRLQEQKSGFGLTAPQPGSNEKTDPVARIAKSLERSRLMGGEGDKPALTRHHFHGRVMIDAAKLHETWPDSLIPKLDRIPESYFDMPDQFDANRMIWKTEEFLEFGGTKTKVPQENLGGQQYIAGDFGQIIVHTSNGDARVTNSVDEEKVTDVDIENLPDSLKVIFSGRIYGYSFSDSRWGILSASNVLDPTWNEKIFKALVVPAELKSRLKRLVLAWKNNSSSFDDYVHGKGKGLIGLLHGNPGLGKTLTAEAIAEISHLPLYQVSSGSLGYRAEQIEASLARILDLTSHWKAVLLLDEADVFMEKRTLNDLERNAIVSVFLREMEYYPGIMLLTTNRQDTIDRAFNSRIHFRIKYNDMTHEIRKEIWLNFLDSAKETKHLDVMVDDEGLDQLAKLELNGREIKNIMSITTYLQIESGEKKLSTKAILDACQFFRGGISVEA